MVASLNLTYSCMICLRIILMASNKVGHSLGFSLYLSRYLLPTLRLMVLIATLFHAFLFSCTPAHSLCRFPDGSWFSSCSGTFYFSLQIIFHFFPFSLFIRRIILCLAKNSRNGTGYQGEYSHALGPRYTSGRDSSML